MNMQQVSETPADELVYTTSLTRFEDAQRLCAQTAWPIRPTGA